MFLFVKKSGIFRKKNNVEFDLYIIRSFAGKSSVMGRYEVQEKDVGNGKPLEIEMKERKISTIG